MMKITVQFLTPPKKKKTTKKQTQKQTKLVAKLNASITFLLIKATLAWRPKGGKCCGQISGKNNLLALSPFSCLRKAVLKSFQYCFACAFQ